MISSLTKISAIGLLLFSSVAIADGARAQGGERYMMDGRPVPRSFFEAGQYVSEGTNLLRANRNQEASEKLKQAIAIAPEFAEAHHNYGLALAKLGDVPGAIEQLKTAVSLKPGLEMGWLSLGGMYQSSGNMEEAIKIYRMFLAKFPASHDAQKINSLVQGLQKEIAFESKPGAATTLGMIAPFPASPDDYLADVTRRGTLRWPVEKMPLKICMHSGAKVPAFNPKYDEIVRNSFLDWSRASNNELTFVFTTNPAQADIDVSWTNEPARFQNTAEAGETRLSSSRLGIVHANIQFCTVPLMAGLAITPSRIRMIALHEIGHALGLTGHTTVPTDAMFYSTVIVDKWRDLSDRDARTMARLYAPASPSAATPSNTLAPAATPAATAVPDGT